MMKFEWLPTECADERFPMQIVHGDFIFPDGSRLYIPENGIINNGWGELGSSHLVGNPLKPLPGRLDITWFSFAENRFYSGVFNLNVRRLTRLFEQGITSPTSGEKAVFDRIIVGLAPEGGVTTWVSGEGIVLGLQNFQANLAEIDWRKILDNEAVSRVDYVAMVLESRLNSPAHERLRKQGLPPGHWARILSRRKWTFEIAGAEAVQFWLRTVDGQREFTVPGKINAGSTNGSLPKDVKLNWKSAGGIRYTFNISFDETEIFAAFAKLQELAPDESLKILFEISETAFSVTISVHTSSYVVQLLKILSKVFRV